MIGRFRQFDLSLGAKAKVSMANCGLVPPVSLSLFLTRFPSRIQRSPCRVQSVRGAIPSFYLLAWDTRELKHTRF